VAEAPKPPKKVEPLRIAKARPLPPVAVPKDAPAPPPQAENAPPPPNDAPPPGARPNAPVMIGISLSSTTSVGGFAAPVGNTLYGAAPTVGPKPEEVKPYASPTGRYVPPFKVTRLPEKETEVEARYPEEARKLGLEGQVVLRLTIDAKGSVVLVKVVRSAGHGFDEAAVEALKRFRFKPAMEGSDPVATEITYTYTFQLEN
jgi:protein TonB